MQQHQAASFGVSQTRVSRLAGVLPDVLNQTLAARNLLPMRDGAYLAERLAEHPHKVFTYDGVERVIPRNVDWEGQQQEYGTKKSLCREKQHLIGWYTVRTLPLAHEIGPAARQKTCG